MLEGRNLSPDAIVQSWKRINPSTSDGAEAYIAAGSFTDAAEAERLAKILAGFGRSAIEHADIDGTSWFSVNLYADGRNGLDDLLKSAWANGAPDAITIRD